MPSAADLRILLVDSHPIYRRGLAACLAALPEVAGVDEASTVAEAAAHPSLATVDVALVDQSLRGALELVRALRASGRVRVLVCCAGGGEREVVQAVQAGAAGVLSKETLSPDALAAAVRAAASGSGVLAPELLDHLLGGLSQGSSDLLERNGVARSRLSRREQDVLRLIADGHATREVAKRLSYSERTIKNVVHDIVTKLNARTRSQAVAAAVREGLI